MDLSRRFDWPRDRVRRVGRLQLELERRQRHRRWWLGRGIRHRRRRRQRAAPQGRQDRHRPRHRQLGVDGRQARGVVARARRHDRRLDEPALPRRERSRRRPVEPGRLPERIAHPVRGRERHPRRRRDLEPRRPRQRLLRRGSARLPEQQRRGPLGLARRAGHLRAPRLRRLGSEGSARAARRLGPGDLHQQSERPRRRRRTTRLRLRSAARELVPLPCRPRAVRRDPPRLVHPDLRADRDRSGGARSARGVPSPGLAAHRRDAERRGRLFDQGVRLLPDGESAAGRADAALHAAGPGGCAANPDDACCTSCAAATPPGCADDPTCDGSTLDAETDPANLRCWDQKRRFGIDFSYPRTATSPR